MNTDYETIPNDEVILKTVQNLKDHGFEAVPVENVPDPPPRPGRPIWSMVL